MSNYTLKYEQSYVGARLTAMQDGADVLTSIHNRGTVYSAKKGQSVILTGYGWYDGQYTNYLLTTTGLYVYVNTLDGTDKMWEITPNAEKLQVHGVSQAQALVNKIIKNDIQITQNNLVCARYASKFTEEQQSLIRELQNRVASRQSALQAQGLCSNVQTSYPKGYSDLSGYLDALMQGNAIGIATWVVVVIAATVIAATATAAYFAYKELADQSEKDVKYSKELTAVLTEKLTAEEYQQLLDETKGIVTKSRLKQAIGSYGRVLWIVGALVAGAFAYKFLANRFNG